MEAVALLLPFCRAMPQRCQLGRLIEADTASCNRFRSGTMLQTINHGKARFFQGGGLLGVGVAAGRLNYDLAL
eukprot:CAMPEP_0174308104 /NCGR_PEP_ID=MMETSP0810-20121108/1535_1 /TAXON_ID=73025 ORGANISM="Eutreptiella gymnastica-like, Strain CCMP1594" /NCGR_SAMPLE_ID=MMETSP0810 /ASSEMBLY_ACC=CAM_ASM_000659 /LENGTH=72 /DNA_ID=CAMNT_0015415321 /DNA_START=1840 /DNA_END=2058 /DNA_ORIENTATION=+